MASILSQQKENINLAAGLSSLAIPRPAPSMLNILSMMGLQQRMLLQQQPAYGLVAPLTQQVTTPPQAQSVASTEAKPGVSGVEQQKANIATPVAVKTSSSPAATREMSPTSSPPHLVAEAPPSFEESLARFRNGSPDSEFMARIAQLNSLSSFWGTSTVSEYR
ncbi:hypothetical protein OESDEN_18212 [Oesophagostomum dentatum]|uniref:Uncharacterized protein n=1 Tax=Oesophagostomum dentatum TaxID=61180 RepID=A0A0B1SDZ0_OESDE|nr:hypothetical protein OESDEN_18212 [Oesophagostomum dentatum]